MYEPSRHIATFYVAGFQYWDGATVIGELASGMGLDLSPERDNPHDPEAVAISWNGTKLGYVPADENGLVSTLAGTRTSWSAACSRRTPPEAPGTSSWWAST